MSSSPRFFRRTGADALGLVAGSFLAFLLLAPVLWHYVLRPGISFLWGNPLPALIALLLAAVWLEGVLESPSRRG